MEQEQEPNFLGKKIRELTTFDRPVSEWRQLVYRSYVMVPREQEPVVQNAKYVELTKSNFETREEIEGTGTTVTRVGMSNLEFTDIYERNVYSFPNLEALLQSYRLFLFIPDMIEKTDYNIRDLRKGDYYIIQQDYLMHQNGILELQKDIILEGFYRLENVNRTQDYDGKQTYIAGFEAGESRDLTISGRDVSRTRLFFVRQQSPYLKRKADSGGRKKNGTIRRYKLRSNRGLKNKKSNRSKKNRRRRN